MNEIGWGSYSSDMTAAMTDLPLAPSMPRKDVDLSTKTSIAFDWESVADNQR
jgi:hypothetical protein